LPALRSYFLNISLILPISVVNVSPVKKFGAPILSNSSSNARVAADSLAVSAAVNADSFSFAFEKTDCVNTLNLKSYCKNIINHFS
jgi:hypothetical protein